MSHDFAVTQRFALFWDTPLKFDPAAMVRADSLPFVFDASLGTRFGVVPRRGDGSADARWFSLPSCMIFHSLGAWEEGEGGGGAVVKLLACRMERFTLALPPRGGGGPGGAQQPPPDPRSAAAAADGGSPTLYEFTFDLRSGAAAQRCVLPLPAGVTGMDFPRAHPALVGRPLRFGYLAAFQGLAVCAAVKVDVTTGAVAARADYPADACGGEPCFVPRRPGDPGLGEAEDDGWVLTFVTTNAATSLWVMGAKALDVEAVLPLPSRLPFGFHSAFITRAEMDAQRGDLPA